MTPNQIQLVFGDSEAFIDTTGSALLSLSLAGAEVMPTPGTPRSLYHGVLLAPWPNRIASGSYQFLGKRYQAKKNEAFGNALHGLLFEAPASVESQTANSCTLVSEITASDAYPWDLTVRISFLLNGDGLRVETGATNNSDTDAPVGLGTHPYFVFDEDSSLEIRAARAFIHDEKMMPISEIDSSQIGFGVGSSKSIENLPLDVQFTELEGSCAVLRTKNWSMEIYQERADYLMLYTTQKYNWADGRTRAVAIEPQTSAADAFNNGQGLLTLAPGASASYVWGARRIS